MRQDFAGRRCADLRSSPFRADWSSCEALCLLAKRKAGFRAFGSSFAGCRALPEPFASSQVAPVVARVSGRCSLVVGGSFRTSPILRHRALCDGSGQSCFDRPCCHGSVVLRGLLPELAGLLQQLPHVRLYRLLGDLHGAQLCCRRCIDNVPAAFAIGRVPSVRIGRLPGRCVTCRPGLSVRTVRRLCHSPRAACLAVSGELLRRVATPSCRTVSASFALRAGIQGFEPWTSVPRGNGFHTVHRLTHLSWVFLGDSALLGPFSAFQGLTGPTLQRISPPLPSRSCRTARADAGASRFLSIVLQRS